MNGILELIGQLVESYLKIKFKINLWIKTMVAFGRGGGSFLEGYTHRKVKEFVNSDYNDRM